MGNLKPSFRLLLCLVTMSMGVVGCDRGFQYETARQSRQASTLSGASSLEFKVFPPKTRVPQILNHKSVFESIQNESISGGIQRSGSFDSFQNKIRFETQKIQGVEVEGTYSKELVKSQRIFQSYHWVRELPFSLRFRILFQQMRQFFVLEEFLRQHELFRQLKIFEKPRLVIRGQDLLWKMTFETRQGRLIGIYWENKKGIVDKVTLGSSFQPAIASLFPDGPLKSNVQRVQLPELQGRQILSTPQLKVVTQSEGAVFSEDSQFVYPPEDPRFEQVQVYYYLSRLVRWSEVALGFKIPFMLEAETNVGFPEKTNTAFYYQRKIRLGEGDGITFSHMALDPSLVTHEGLHSIIDSVSRLPFQGEGGSLNEAFADFFTAVLLDNPRMGEVSYKKASYRRTLENQLGRQDAKGSLYGDSLVVSGLLWSLSKRLGQKVGLQLAWETLLRMNPQSQISDFGFELRELISELDSDSVRMQASEVLDSRGWP